MYLSEEAILFISPLNIYMHRKCEVPGSNSGFTSRLQVGCRLVAGWLQCGCREATGWSYVLMLILAEVSLGAHLV